MNNINRVAIEESLEEDWNLFETSNKALLYYMDNYNEDFARKPNKKSLRSLRKCKRLDYKFKGLESKINEIVRSGNVQELKKLIKKTWYTYLNIQNQTKNVANKSIDVFISEIINQEIDEYGNRPLHIATLSNRFEMVKFLIERNALLFAINKKGENPIWPCLFGDSYYSKVGNYLESQKQWKEFVFQNKMKFEKDLFAKTYDEGKRRILNEDYRKYDYHFVYNFRCFHCGERIEKESGFFYKEWFCSTTCIEYRKRYEKLCW